MAWYPSDIKETAYSTSEVFTGDYWIDGKPIYRKVFTGTTPSEASVYRIGTIANFGELVTAHFLLHGNNFYADGAIYSGSTYTPLDIGYVLENNGNNNAEIIYKSYAPAYFNKPIKAIIEYTKTTD